MSRCIIDTNLKHRELTTERKFKFDVYVLLMGLPHSPTARIQFYALTA
jgi:hypothetical protein